MSSRLKPERPIGTPAAAAWTIESVRGLGLTANVDTAACILGISRTKAYALAKHGGFPIKLVRIGRRYLVPIPALLDLLTGAPVDRIQGQRRVSRLLKGGLVELQVCRVLRDGAHPTIVKALVNRGFDLDPHGEVRSRVSG